MARFKVVFYFGTTSIDNKIPSEIIEVEANENSTPNEVALIAMKKMGALPRTRLVDVIKIDDEQKEESE